jgi:hypothetical protein
MFRGSWEISELYPFPNKPASPQHQTEHCGLIFGWGGFRVASMKSKQLANVLIKIIGLYVCLTAIPSFLSGILIGLSSFGWSKPDTTGMVMRMVSISIADAIQAAVGIFLIIKSRKLAEFWFKNEDE